jgi:hypothetical protein
LARGEAGDAEGWLDGVAGELAARSIPCTMVAVDHGRGLLRLATGDLGAARTDLKAAAARWEERRRFWEASWARLDLAGCALKARRLAEGAALATEGRARAERATARAVVALSPKTVAVHVEHILTKLGAGRRTEIAAWVAAQPVALGRPER